MSDQQRLINKYITGLIPQVAYKVQLLFLVSETDEAETAEGEETEDVIADDDGESDYEAGVLVFGADDKLTVYDQHKLGHEELLRSVYIGDYIYALDREGNVKSFKFSEKN